MDYGQEAGEADEEYEQDVVEEECADGGPQE